MPARRLALALPLILASHAAHAQDGTWAGVIFGRLDGDASGEVTAAALTFPRNLENGADR